MTPPSPTTPLPCGYELLTPDFLREHGAVKGMLFWDKFNTTQGPLWVATGYAEREQMDESHLGLPHCAPIGTTAMLSTPLPEVRCKSAKGFCMDQDDHAIDCPCHPRNALVRVPLQLLAGLPKKPEGLLWRHSSADSSEWSNCTMSFPFDLIESDKFFAYALPRHVLDAIEAGKEEMAPVRRAFAKVEKLSDTEVAALAGVPSQPAATPDESEGAKLERRMGGGCGEGELAHPETDAVMRQYAGSKRQRIRLIRDHARALERQRDEARKEVVENEARRQEIELQNARSVRAALDDLTARVAQVEGEKDGLQEWSNGIVKVCRESKLEWSPWSSPEQLAESLKNLFQNHIDLLAQLSTVTRAKEQLAFALTDTLLERDTALAECQRLREALNYILNMGDIDSVQLAIRIKSHVRAALNPPKPE